MDTPPPLQDGFVRLAVLFEDEASRTPGELARLTGLSAEDLGPILVDEGQAVIDVRLEHSKALRERLEAYGPVQLLGKAVEQPDYRWLRLHIGRNHGLTVKQLRRLLDQAGAEPIGSFHVLNTHVDVGVRADRLDRAIERLRDRRVNGMPLRPETVQRRDPAERRRPR